MLSQCLLFLDYLDCPPLPERVCLHSHQDLLSEEGPLLWASKDVLFSVADSLGCKLYSGGCTSISSLLNLGGGPAICWCGVMPQRPKNEKAVGLLMPVRSVPGVWLPLLDTNAGVMGWVSLESYGQSAWSGCHGKTQPRPQIRRH
jgi:hypothetical protein